MVLDQAYATFKSETCTSSILGLYQETNDSDVTPDLQGSSQATRTFESPTLGRLRRLAPIRSNNITSRTSKLTDLRLSPTIRSRQHRIEAVISIISESAIRIPGMVQLHLDNAFSATFYSRWIELTGFFRSTLASIDITAWKYLCYVLYCWIAGY